MPIDPKTEILHPELGSIRFDDGKAVSPIAGTRDSAAKWVCRPDGWDSDSELEIYVLGDAHSPQNLERAILAVRHRKQIEADGKRLSGSDVYLSWIDTTTEPPTVAFPRVDEVYVIWKGWLDDSLQIRDFKEGTW